MATKVSHSYFSEPEYGDISIELLNWEQSEAADSIEDIYYHGFNDISAFSSELSLQRRFQGDISPSLPGEFSRSWFSPHTHVSTDHPHPEIHSPLSARIDTEPPSSLAFPTSSIISQWEVFSPQLKPPSSPCNLGSRERMHNNSSHTHLGVPSSLALFWGAFSNAYVGQEDKANEKDGWDVEPPKTISCTCHHSPPLSKQLLWNEPVCLDFISKDDSTLLPTDYCQCGNPPTDGLEGQTSVYSMHFLLEKEFDSTSKPLPVGDFSVGLSTPLWMQSALPSLTPDEDQVSVGGKLLEGGEIRGGCVEVVSHQESPTKSTHFLPHAPPTQLCASSPGSSATLKTRPSLGDGGGGGGGGSYLEASLMITAYPPEMVASQPPLVKVANDESVEPRKELQGSLSQGLFGVASPSPSPSHTHAPMKASCSFLPPQVGRENEDARASQTIGRCFDGGGELFPPSLPLETASVVESQAADYRLGYQSNLHIVLGGEKQRVGGKEDEDGKLAEKPAPCVGGNAMASPKQTNGEDLGGMAASPARRRRNPPTKRARSKPLVEGNATARTPQVLRYENDPSGGSLPFRSSDEGVIKRFKREEDELLQCVQGGIKAGVKMEEEAAASSFEALSSHRGENVMNVEDSGESDTHGDAHIRTLAPTHMLASTRAPTHSPAHPPTHALPHPTTHTIAHPPASTPTTPPTHTPKTTHTPRNTHSARAYANPSLTHSSYSVQPLQCVEEKPSVKKEELLQQEESSCKQLRALPLEAYGEGGYVGRSDAPEKFEVSLFNPQLQCLESYGSLSGLHHTPNKEWGEGFGIAKEELYPHQGGGAGDRRVAERVDMMKSFSLDSFGTLSLRNLSFDEYESANGSEADSNSRLTHTSKFQQSGKASGGGTRRKSSKKRGVSRPKKGFSKESLKSHELYCLNDIRTHAGFDGVEDLSTASSSTSLLEREDSGSSVNSLMTPQSHPSSPIVSASTYNPNAYVFSPSFPAHAASESSISRKMMESAANSSPHQHFNAVEVCAMPSAVDAPCDREDDVKKKLLLSCDTHFSGGVCADLSGRIASSAALSSSGISWTGNEDATSVNIAPSHTLHENLYVKSNEESLLATMSAESLVCAEAALRGGESNLRSGGTQERLSDAQRMSDTHTSRNSPPPHNTHILPHILPPFSTELVGTTSMAYPHPFSLNECSFIHGDVAKDYRMEGFSPHFGSPASGLLPTASSSPPLTSSTACSMGLPPNTQSGPAQSIKVSGVASNDLSSCQPVCAMGGGVVVVRGLPAGYPARGGSSRKACNPQATRKTASPNKQLPVDEMKPPPGVGSVGGDHSFLGVGVARRGGKRAASAATKRKMIDGVAGGLQCSEGGTKGGFEFGDMKTSAVVCENFEGKPSVGVLSSYHPDEALKVGLNEKKEVGSPSYPPLPNRRSSRRLQPCSTSQRSRSVRTPLPTLTTAPISSGRIYSHEDGGVLLASSQQQQALDSTLPPSNSAPHSPFPNEASSSFAKPQGALLYSQANYPPTTTPQPKPLLPKASSGHSRRSAASRTTRQAASSRSVCTPEGGNSIELLGLSLDPSSSSQESLLQHSINHSSYHLPQEGRGIEEPQLPLARAGERTTHGKGGSPTTTTHVKQASHHLPVSRGAGGVLYRARRGIAH